MLFRSPLSAADVCTNDLIAGANDFSIDEVKAAAEAVPVSEAMAAVDIASLREHMFDQAIGAGG